MIRLDSGFGKGFDTTFPNAYFPLYKREVKSATGLCAETLKTAIEASPEQYGPGVVQSHYDGTKHHYRFNPYLHVEYLKEKQKWHAIPRDQEHTSEGAPGGSSGVTDSAEKSVTGSSLQMEQHYRGVLRTRKSRQPQPQPIMSGSEYLKQLRAQEIQKKKQP